MWSLFPVGIRLRIWQQWVQCNCSWYLAISQSEAWSCFEDPPTFNSTEKNSTNTNQLVLFSVFLLYSEMICLKKWSRRPFFINLKSGYRSCSQILTKLTRRKLCADLVYRVASMAWSALRHWIPAMVRVRSACCSQMKRPPTWLIWMNPMGSDPYHPSSASLQALCWSHVSCNSDCKRWSQENSKNTAFLKKKWQVILHWRLYVRPNNLCFRYFLTTALGT